MKIQEKLLSFESAHILGDLYVNKHENLSLIENGLKVKIIIRDNLLTIQAKDKDNLELAIEFFGILKKAKKQGLRVSDIDFNNMLEKVLSGKISELRDLFKDPIVIQLRKRSIIPKNINQKRYIEAMSKNDISFGIGPAGTGKTYLAVAYALKLLEENKINKIILTRPAVEAGEALGFLPGDLQEKLLPYLRPLYDAMFDMLSTQETSRLMEKQIIEIAPLAYMRGRTLQNAFIILDEAQNTTSEQMMMFLTRLGEDSKMVITGDLTQTDLPKNKKSGLRVATNILDNIEGIKIFRFQGYDVIRHKLVTKIIDAYDKEYRKNV